MLEVTTIGIRNQVGSKRLMKFANDHRLINLFLGQLACKAAYTYQSS